MKLRLITICGTPVVEMALDPEIRNDAHVIDGDVIVSHGGSHYSYYDTEGTGSKQTVVYQERKIVGYETQSTRLTGADATASLYGRTIG